jgi:hypothetical protein
MNHRTHDAAGYVAHRTGTTGCEIKNPAGDTVAWTVDGYWGALVAALLNEMESHGLVHPSPMTVEERGKPPKDREATAREAIAHLAYNGLALQFDLPGAPPEAVRALVASYLKDGEMVETLGDMATKYVMKRMADDHLGLGPLVEPDTASP